MTGMILQVHPSSVWFFNKQAQGIWLMENEDRKNITAVVLK